jgi:hypothetical protein
MDFSIFQLPDINVSLKSVASGAAAMLPASAVGDLVHHYFIGASALSILIHHL